MKKLKSLYINGIVKDSKNNMEKYLFSENERLNAIIDDLEEKIDKAIEYLKAMQNSDLIFTAICEKELLEILGDKENE